MPVPGKEIFRCYDDFGVIRVIEQSPYRYLAFGDGGEQSCVLYHAPALLVHQYARTTMLATLLVSHPRKVMVLGLGAGGMVNALLQLPDRLQVTVVELRAQVAAVARDWFGFTADPRLQLVISDAESYLCGQLADYDLLFADLYHDEGMDEVQVSPQFLADCSNQLADDGVLVLNLWDNGRGLEPQLLAVIGELFDGGCWYCPVEEGNLVVFAFRSPPPPLSHRRLLAAAKRRGEQFGFPLQQLLPALRVGCPPYPD